MKSSTMKSPLETLRVPPYPGRLSMHDHIRWQAPPQLWHSCSCNLRLHWGGETWKQASQERTSSACALCISERKRPFGLEAVRSSGASLGPAIPAPPSHPRRRHEHSNQCEPSHHPPSLPSPFSYLLNKCHPVRLQGRHGLSGACPCRLTTPQDPSPEAPPSSPSYQATPDDGRSTAVLTDPHPTGFS